MLEGFGIIPVDRVGPKTKWLARLYTLLVVVCAFVLFRAESFGQAWSFIANMFAGVNGVGFVSAKIYLTPMFLTILAIGIIGCVPWLHIIKTRMVGKRAIGGGGNFGALNAVSYVVSLALLALCMLALASAASNPFIYFRF